MFRPAIILVAAVLPLAACTGDPQAQVQNQPALTDPLIFQDQMIRNAMQQDEARRRNEAMRLELERRDLEDQLRYRRASNQQIKAELARYCPSGEPPCSQPIPQPLLQEAGRRGFIELKPQQPSTECVTMSDGLGGGITECN